MWSQRKMPSQPRSSARAARSASRRGSLSALNGARVSPRLASRVMALNVYLSGEIHTDWRERIERGAAEAGLDVEFGSPVTDHGASDNAGVGDPRRAGAPVLERQPRRGRQRDPHPHAARARRRRRRALRRPVPPVERRVRRRLRRGAGQAARRAAPGGARPCPQGGRPRRRSPSRASPSRSSTSCVTRCTGCCPPRALPHGDADRGALLEVGPRRFGVCFTTWSVGEHLLEHASAVDVGLELADRQALLGDVQLTCRRDRARACGR